MKAIPYVVLGKCVSGGRSHAYFLFFRSGQGEERVVVRRDFWETVSTGDTVLFTIHRGLFGFPVVVKIEKQQANKALRPTAYSPTLRSFRYASLPSLRASGGG